MGGRAETGFAPVGYLFNASYPEYATFCGVTLVAPSVVVTAAHCVQGYDASTLSVGFGDASASPPPARVGVSAAHVLPGFVERDVDDYTTWNDVAVLELATPVTDRAPATIARAVAGGCVHRYVGYGRDTEGGADVTTGYDSQRKSASICLDAETATELFVHGGDGGLCWGDSGGALVVDGAVAGPDTRAPTRIVGVLSRHAARADAAYSCENGNRMVFTSLASHADFVSTWAPNAFEPPPSPPARGASVGWCNVQWPPVAHGAPFAESDVVYGRVWVDGVTPGAGQGAGVVAEVGFAPAGAAPGADGWAWYAARYNVDADGLAPGDRANDEYAGQVFPYAAGSYDVAYRFSVDAAHTWTTCGTMAKLDVE